MKNIIESTLNGLIPSVTENISVAAKEATNGMRSMLDTGAGIINNDGSINQNPQAFGFAFEHLQALGFNINAGLNNSDLRAYQIPADGTKYGADIYVTDKIGKIVAEIQAKAGQSNYVSDAVNSGNYRGDILTNAENQGISGTTINIDLNGIKSFPVNVDVAKWVAKNPYQAANIIRSGANLGEIGLSGIQGAAINSTINILLQSIKIVGAYCRGETELTKKELDDFIAVVLDGLKKGFLRGTAIKIIQKITSGNAFAALGFTIGVEVIPVLIKVLNNEMNIDRAIEEVGYKAFTSGVVTTLVILFPPIGMALLSASVIQAIWLEISPEWQKYCFNVAITTVKASEKGVKAGAEHLNKNPWDFFGSSSASYAASSAEMKALQNELDLLLE